MSKNNPLNKLDINDAEIANILNAIERAKDENRQFGIAIERVFSGLVDYKKDAKIPYVYWELSANLLNSLSVDSAPNDLVYSEVQLEVMSSVYEIMKTKGLAITLPDKETLHQQLLSTTKNLPFTKFLERIFFSPFIRRSGQTIEANYFLMLTTGNINIEVISEIVNNEKLLVETTGESDAKQIRANLKGFMDLVMHQYPDKLSEAFWDNPEVVKYHKQNHMFFAKNFLGLLGL